MNLLGLLRLLYCDMHTTNNSPNMKINLQETSYKRHTDCFPVISFALHSTKVHTTIQTLFVCIDNK